MRDINTMLTILSVAALYTGLHVLLFVALSFMVMRERRRAKIGLGVGDDMKLLRIVRVHGNAAEYVPVILIMMLMLALLDVSPLMLHVYGIITLAARILHASGIHKSENRTMGRFLGTALTWGSLAVGSITLIIISLTRG